MKKTLKDCIDTARHSARLRIYAPPTTPQENRIPLQIEPFYSIMQNDIAVIKLNLKSATLDDAIKFKVYIERLLNSGIYKIIIDLSSCDSIDSTFWGTLIYITRIMQKWNEPPRLIYTNKESSSIYMVSNLYRIFHIYDAIAPAIDTFNKSAVS